MILHYGGSRKLISRPAFALAIVPRDQKGSAAMPDLSKREAHVLVLSEAEVMDLLDPSELLDGLADGFRALAAGEIETPERPAVTVPGKGFSLAMPAWMAGRNITVKIVNV